MGLRIIPSNVIHLGGGHSGLQVSGGGVTYLLRDEFTTDLAAGAVNGTAAEPGPSTRAVTDTESKLSTTGGRAVFSGGKASPAFGDPAMWYGAITRAAGVAFGGIVRFGSTSGLMQFGWDDGQAGLAGLSFYNGGSATLLIYDTAQVSNVGPIVVAGVDYKFVAVQRATGMFYFIWGNGIIVPRLVWVGSTLATTPLYPSVQSYSNSPQFDDLWVSNVAQKLSGFSSAFGMAAAYSATPATNDVVTSSTDGIVEMTWTPAASETLSIYFRRTDDDNTWRLDCDQAGGTIKLFKRTAGSDAEQNAGKTQTWTIGTAYRVIISMDNNGLIKTWVNLTTKHSVLDVYNKTVTGVKVTGFTAGSNLACWPLGTGGEYTLLDSFFT